VIVSTCIAE